MNILEDLKHHQIWLETSGKNGIRFSAIGADLRGADLTGFFLDGSILNGSDLSGARLVLANLNGANLVGAKLSGANLVGAKLSGAKLSGARLVGAKLSGADLSFTDLSEANLSEADLSEADLNGAKLSGTKLSGAKLSGTKLSGAKLSGAKLSGVAFTEVDLSKVAFTEVDLSEANLSGANLSGANFSKANFSGANLSGANFSGAELSGANLSEANLSGANLIGANLSGAKLIGANFIGADLSGAKLSGAKLSGFDLGSIDLSKVDFTEVDLCKASLSKFFLSGANFSGANFIGADLSGANLSEANLSEANLSEANLSEANLSGANLSEANLKRVQALQTNFKYAVLTGVCIEDWNINANTNLEKVKCQAVFLKITRGNYTDRRPSDENAIFAEGDFARLVRKAQDTVDLIFRNGIDWKAFAISIEQFKVESDGAELSIQAIENKGEGDFVIRVNVPADANKSELEKFLMREYESARNALEAQYIAQLEAKDKQNQDYRQDIEFYRQQNTNLLEAVKFLSVRPITINVENIAIADSKSASDNTSINQSGANNPNATVAKDNAYVQNILHNYPAEQQKGLAEAAAEIQQLLEQLSATYPTMTIAEKSAVATKAIDTIEKNPAQKAKIVKALKVGGIAALKELVEPVMKSVTNILFPMLEELTKD